MDPIQVESTHTISDHRGVRMVCEIEPGIFVINGGSVKSADVAVHLFAVQPRSERESFTVSGRQLLRVQRIAASRELN